jgi:Trk K+ transport system NAD-binding subunit
VVVEIRDPKNMEITRLVGGAEVEIIMVGELISRVIAQTCRQSGLSTIYTELLDFGGDEIYMKEEPELVGKTVGDALMAYEDSTVIGIKPREQSPRLNPPMDTLIQTGDQLIVVSKDDSTIHLARGIDPRINTQLIAQPQHKVEEPEQNIILGWNWRGQTLVTEMDHYMPSGSTIHIVSSYPEVQTAVENLSKVLCNTSLTFSSSDTTDRKVLNELNIPAYDHVILLCYSDHMGEQEADSVTLITLLHLRDISKKSGVNFSITSEMLDVHNRALAEITEADDFIVSDNLISLMMAQVSENKYLNAVLEDLFDPEGCEIYLKPVEEYVQTGQPVNFYTVLEAARRRGQVAMGYRILAEAKNAAKAYGIVVNPDKSKPVVFTQADKIIVVASD